MPSPAPLPSSRDVLVIGAGMAGLTAAAALHAAGRTVLVVEKARGVGGRLATRRIAAAVFDHGAQFITVRDARFAAAVAEWRDAGAAAEWCRGFTGAADGHLRWRGQPGMTAIAKHLAAGLNVHVETVVSAVTRDGAAWRISTQTGTTFHAGAVIVTAPVPQTLALLEAGKVEIADGVRQRLEAIRYERCLAVMATLHGPSRVPPPGALRIDPGPVAWIADNQQKGISPAPAITVHATPDFSLANWDRDRLDVGRELLDGIPASLGVSVKEFHVHGWRYSRPISRETGGALLLHDQPPLLIAGDALAGPRVEGAALSGWAAAAELLTRCRDQDGAGHAGFSPLPASFNPSSDCAT